MIATRQRFARSHSGRSCESGSFGILEAIASLFLVALVTSVALYLTNTAGAVPLGAAQARTRVVVQNAVTDLAATAAYDSSTLSALNGQSSVPMTEAPLPALTPFPSASALPTEPPNSSAYSLSQPSYDSSTRILSATVTNNGANVSVQISQRTFGKANCDPALQTSGTITGATPVPGC
jgi:hypothetical protein